MLTYADIQRIYRLEKNSTSLQNIPDNFYAEIKLLLSKIDEEHHSYIKKITEELYEKRKQKILLQAMRGDEEPPNLTREEKRLYSEIMNLLENYEHIVVSSEGVPPRVEGEEKVVEIQEEQQKESEIEGKKEVKERREEEQKENEIRDKTEIKEAREEQQKEIPDTIKLKILETLPAIVGFNSTSYGPFQENQEVTLPEEIAKILIEKGVAERVLE